MQQQQQQQQNQYITRNLRGLTLINYKKTLKLTTIQKEVLIGTLLGDASITKQKCNVNIKFQQKLANFQYINHLYTIFQPYTGSPPRICQRLIQGGGAKHRQSIWFRTYRHSQFLFYYNLFYPKHPKTQLRKKRVPKNIDRFLTKRALAYWFMDHGSFDLNYSKTTKKRVYYFNTQGFIYSDIQRLQKALKLNFNLHTNIYRDRIYYLFYIQPESTVAFVNLIEQFLLPIFYYKCGKDVHSRCTQ